MKQPPFAFDVARHDRNANMRLSEQWRNEDCSVMVVGGEHVATVDGPALRWLDAAEAPAGEWLYLGTRDGQHFAAVMMRTVPADLEPTSIRVLAPLLDPNELSLGIHAVAMTRWLQTHTYCSRCGEYVYATEGGHLLECHECGAKHFPRTDPAVIMAVLDQDDRILLGRNAEWPERRFSTLAGFVEPGESLEDAVRREVAEEVGLQVHEVEYRASQPWPFPSSLMLGFFAHVAATEVVVAENEIAEARWFTHAELTQATETGEVLLPPPGVSISSWLIESWHGSRLPGGW